MISTYRLLISAWIEPILTQHCNVLANQWLGEGASALLVEYDPKDGSWWLRHNYPRSSSERASEDRSPNVHWPGLPASTASVARLMLATLSCGTP